jgi:hypothetical protein
MACQTRDRGSAGLPYGRLKIACGPTRRQRIPGSPPISTHSHVARPSGSERLQVISQTSGAPTTRLTRNERCQGSASPAAARTAQSWKSGNALPRNFARWRRESAL